jgi:hypothetical protein
MFRLRMAARLTATAPLALAGILLSACSGSIDTGPAPRADLGCVDDSKQCIEQRQGALRALQADRTRKWVRDPATIQSYATGVRLYAFKTEKRKLSCEELAIGRREAANGPAALRGPSGQGLTPSQIARGVIFAEEVGKELGNEAKRRCGG